MDKNEWEALKEIQAEKIEEIKQEDIEKIFGDTIKETSKNKEIDSVEDIQDILEKINLETAKFLDKEGNEIISEIVEVPEGMYNAILTNAKFKINHEKGSQTIHLGFKILDGEFANAYISKNYILVSKKASENQINNNLLSFKTDMAKFGYMSPKLNDFEKDSYNFLINQKVEITKKITPNKYDETKKGYEQISFKLIKE